MPNDEPWLQSYSFTHFYSILIFVKNICIAKTKFLKIHLKKIQCRLRKLPDKCHFLQTFSYFFTIFCFLDLLSFSFNFIFINNFNVAKVSAKKIEKHRSIERASTPRSKMMSCTYDFLFRSSPIKIPKTK